MDVLHAEEQIDLKLFNKNINFQITSPEYKWVSAEQRPLFTRRKFEN